MPTKMGGPGAPDELRLGHLTQEWLATSEDPEARTPAATGMTSAGPSRIPLSVRRFQDQLVEDLAGFTATRLL